MLERCFARPQTVDRIRSSWLGAAIEQYVTWLLERGHAPRVLGHRVPVLLHFATFTYDRGARCYADLPPAVHPFVEHWITRPDHRRAPGAPRPGLAREIRRPIEQMLRLVVPGFVGTRRPVLGVPFIERAPDFFAYLRDERGLRAATLRQYGHHLRQFRRVPARAWPRRPAGAVAGGHQRVSDRPQPPFLPVERRVAVRRAGACSCVTSTARGSSDAT